jgi:hypothetical protein
MEQRPKKLLDQVRDAIRLKPYSHRTEESYIHWIKRYILFHNERHPVDTRSAEIEAFLTYLPIKKGLPRPPRIRRLARSCFCTAKCRRRN